MPSIAVPAFWQDFAANGDSTGKIQVSDSSGFFVGCIGYIQRDDAEARVIIVAVPDSTHVQVRIIADDNEQQAPLQRYGGFSDLTGWTTAKHSRVSMEDQIARVDPAWVARRQGNG
jgi:hypothetical protein